MTDLWQIILQKNNFYVFLHILGYMQKVSRQGDIPFG